MRLIWARAVCRLTEVNPGTCVELASVSWVLAQISSYVADFLLKLNLWRALAWMC